MDTLLAMQLPPTATDVCDSPECEPQFDGVARAADEALVAVLVEDFDWDMEDFMDAILEGGM